MSQPALLEMIGVTKTFPGVRALDHVSFELRPGEIHALLGENGAGKSTLMKVLFGAIQPDSGAIRINGREVVIRSPKDAHNRGISMVHQELNLIPQMNAIQNIALGREPGPAGILDWGEMTRRAREQLQRLGVLIDIRAPVRALSVAQQQMIEIARALSWNARVLVLDEPTSALTEHEIDELFRVLRSLAAEGVGIIFISHHLEEIFAIADRITVLRDGRHIATRPTNELTHNQLISLMVGRSVETIFPKQHAMLGNERLRVEGLRRPGAPHRISFSVRKGEIVGIAGLIGSGRTELVRAIFGADPIAEGAIYVDGRRVTIRSPRDATRAGIGMLPEDRKAQGLVLEMSVASNMALPSLDLLNRFSALRVGAIGEMALQYVNSLRIKTPTIHQRVGQLSGGNQQKVVLGKWLGRGVRVLIFDEPTRGIDVGAKVEVYQLFAQLAADGVAILMVSSELPEALGLSDRVLVMRNGAIVAELDRERATPERVMLYATGGGDMQSE
jgi:ribose transport system ATP-binding protein